MSPDDELLQELVHARDACAERRAAAERTGALRVRRHAIDSELAGLVEKIQRHCAVTGTPLPPGIPPLSRARANAITLSQSVLLRYVGLLGNRRAVRAAAARAGDAATVQALDFAIRADLETIRKHCERAGLPLPPEAIAAEDDSPL